jgi:hypothetical protein
MKRSGKQLQIDTVRLMSKPSVAPNIREHMLGTYQTLRRLLAVGALLLLVLVGYVFFFETNLSLRSISALYYHTGTYFLVPVVFISLLCMKGVLLIAYKGYTAGENWLLNLAGLGLLVVANCPMDQAPGDWNQLSLTGKAHVGGAVVFFVCVSLVMAVYAKNTLPHMRKDARLQGRFRTLYAVYGAVLFMMLAITLVLFFLKWPVIILAAECTGVLVFGAYWITKSLEMSMGLLETVEGIRQLPEDATAS